MKSNNLRDFPTAQEKRKFLQEKLNVNLENISQTIIKEEQVTGRNIENFIGSTQIPLGVAGPIRVKSQESRIKEYYIPLATTEGALVASISRGCKAITQSGGVQIIVEDVGQTRGPVFKTSGILHSEEIKNWIEKNFKLIAKTTESTSSHIKLIKTQVNFEGKRLFVRFSYSTSDAMGMNMVTIATATAVKLIEEKTKAVCIALAGNYDVDKKPSWLNFTLGRGKKVWAEAIIDKKTLSEVLKTDSQNIVEVVKSKTHMGSIMSGSLGFNSHFANIVAAIFAATGQDLAHVVEGSLGITDAETLENGSLYFSIYLPSLQIGTVGGGTNLPTQKEAFSIMGNPSMLEYAQIVAGAVLAGELSLIASLAEGTLAKAHQRLGRKSLESRVKSLDGKEKSSH